MRIGIDVSQAIYKTGVSDYTIDLVHALAKVDPSNDYVLFGSSLRRVRDLKKLFPDARTFNLPPMFLHLLWNKLHVVNVENFIGDLDVFHSSDWTQPPTSCPKVTTVHDLSPFLFPDEMASGAFRNISAVHRDRMKWVVRECSRIICVSQATAGDLQKLFPIDNSKITIIPEALPTRFKFHPSPGEISEVKKKYQLSDYLLAIGTPSPRKNIPGLVKAYLEFQTKLGLPEKLVIIGGHGWGITNIPTDPRLIFTGFLPDKELAALLSEASAFVYPSFYEGFGLPILLAFYHQVPVLTSNTSSMPEVAGKAAILIDPKNLEAIGYGIQKALKDRSRLTKAGLARLSKFDWEDSAKQTLMIYSQLC